VGAPWAIRPSWKLESEAKTKLVRYDHECECGSFAFMIITDQLIVVAEGLGMPDGKAAGPSLQRIAVVGTEAAEEAGALCFIGKGPGAARCVISSVLRH
jgi:hypothetical protein